MERTSAWWGAPIYHPLPLSAALVLAVNDHWLKGTGLLPQVVVGKISDVAGLFFFPILCLALIQGLGSLILKDHRLPAWCSFAIVGLTGAAFAAANLDPTFNGWLAGWWGVKVMDPTDLLTLPVLGLSWLWISRTRRATGGSDAG